MKKLLSLLLSVLLVTCLAFTFTACGEEEKSESIEVVSPITYTFKLISDDDGNESYSLTSFALSEEAKEFVDAEDWSGLAILFSNKLPDEIKGDKDHYSSASARILTIPSVWGADKLPVTKIEEGAISNQAFIEKLVVPDSVTEIELGAFSGLVNLKEITLPFVGRKLGATNHEKLFGYIFGTIGSDKFTSVTQTYNEGSENNTYSYYIPSNLEKVIVTGDVKATSTTYSYYIDEDNNHVVIPEDDADFVIPEGVKTYVCEVKSYTESAIQPYAFHSVSMLKEIEFKGEITEIPNFAFVGCGFKSLDFSKFATITKIGRSAFANCVSIKTINFGSVTEILESAFSGCTLLGKTYESVGYKNDLDLTGITLGKDAFAGCTSLEKDNILGVDFDTPEAAEAFGDLFDDEEDGE